MVVVVRRGNLPVPPDPFHWSASADERSALDQKNSPSRFRFHPPLPLTFPFRVLPSDSVSTYLRSVLGASSTLTRPPSGSRDRKRTWPQFAEICFFNVSTAFLPACGNVCGKESAALEQPPRRRNERICHALDEPNACGEKRSSNLDGDDRRGETNHAAGQNVGRIVEDR